ncbi:MAG: dUTP diphosphatase [Chlamydiota bacterium]
MSSHECSNSSLVKEVTLPVVSDKKAQLPVYASDEAAGADVYACLSEEVVLHPRERKLISTGLKFEIPKGYEIQVRPRSGLALKHGVTVLNSPGTIDSDYRGVVGIILVNLGESPFSVTPGMRIAQIVLAPVYRAKFVKQEMLATTNRGEGGFGHTGVH